jgi:hypothetical protein
VTRHLGKVTGEVLSLTHDRDVWRTISEIGAANPTVVANPFVMGLVADIQSRLFWRVGTGRASECCVPSAGWSQTSRMGSDALAGQRLQGFDPLRCRGQGS